MNNAEMSQEKGRTVAGARFIEEFDLNALVEKIDEELLVAEELHGRDLVLFLGTTNAGKTTTICFLGERGGGLRIKQEMICDPDGSEMLGEEKIDTAVLDESFGISHDGQSTTTAIQICALPGTELKLVDSCGFQDIERCTTDVVNASALRNAMMVGHSVRPVIVIDVNIIGLGEGVPFARFLQLLTRFFSPIENYFPSLSFLFTRARPDVNCDAVKKTLSKFLKTPLVSEDTKTKDLVEYLMSYFKNNSDTCLLNSNKIAAPPSARIAALRTEIAQLIFESVPLSPDQTSNLGSPLSNEMHSAILERCQERNNQITRSLRSYSYALIVEPFRQLGVLQSSLALGAVGDILSACKSRITNHLRNLFKAADSHLKMHQYHPLAEKLSRCVDAQCLDNIFDVSSALQSHKLSLNKQVIMISELILAKGQKPFDYIDRNLLTDLQQIRDTLGFFVVTKSPHDYDAIMHHIKSLLNHVGLRSLSILNFLQSYLTGNEDLFDFTANLYEMDQSSLFPLSLPQPPQENALSSSLLFSSMSILFHDLLLLKSIELLHNHVDSDLVSLYTNSRDPLISVFEICDHLIFGETGFVSSITHLTWSESQTIQMAKIYEFLKICFSVGAKDHLGRRFSDLPVKMVSGIQNAITQHLSLIDHMLVHQQFDDLFMSLKVITTVELLDESYQSFRLNIVEGKILSVKENVKKVYIQANHQLRLVVENDFIQTSEYQIIAKFMKNIRDICEFNFISSVNHLHTSSESQHDRPSQWLMTLVSICRQDWSRRLSQFYDALSGNKSSHLSEIFLRLDLMEPLWGFLSEMDEDTSNICCALERNIDNFLANPQILTDYLPRCDHLLKLSSHFSTSSLLRRHLSDTLNDWSTQRQAALSGWREMTFQARFRLTESRIKEAIHLKDVRSLANDLNLLDQHRSLDTTASALYLDACEFVKTELLNLSQFAAAALSREDFKELDSILLFLEDSTILETHLQGLDLQGIVASLSSKSNNRQGWGRVPGDILTLLEKQKFRNISSKLRVVRKEDPNIYQECDTIVSDYFRRLANSLDSSPQDFTMWIEFYSHSLSMFQQCLVLSAEVSYDFRVPIQKLFGFLDRQFSGVISQMIECLRSYQFEQASLLFDQLVTFKSFDSHLLEIKDTLKTNIEIFQPQIDHFTKRSILPLPETLINDCHSLLAPVSILSECQDSTALDSSINLSELITLVKSVSAASDELFDRLVSFSSLKKQLLGIFLSQFGETLSQIKLLISRCQLDLAESLISSSHYFFLSLLEPLSLARHSEVTRLLKEQQQALHCATNFMSRPHLTNLAIETIDEISSQLKSLRSDRFDHFSELYHQYSTLVREEILKCQPLCHHSASHRVISCSSPLDLIRSVRLIKKFSLLIIDRNLDAVLLKECDELVTYFEPYMSKYLEYIIRSVAELNNVPETQDAIVQFRNLLPCLLQEQLINPDCEKRWIRDTDHFLKCAEELLIRLSDDFQVLSRYDLFLSKDPTLLLEKYQILRNHHRFGAICIDELSKKLSLPQLIEYFVSGDLATAAEGLRCLYRLSSLPELQKLCADIDIAFQHFLLDRRMDLLESVKREFAHKNFKVVNKLIQDAASIDEHFGPLVNDKNLCNLLCEIMPLFRKELDLILRSSDPDSSLDDHAKAVISMKTLVSEISHQDIQKLVERSIQRYFCEHKSIDFYQLGIILAQSGAIGEELTESYPQFKSLLVKRFNEATASITITHALEELSRLNPSITRKQISKLSEAYFQFSHVYDKALNNYFPGYQSFNPSPLDELVVNIQNRAASCSSPTASDYVDLLAWVFAVWTIISSHALLDDVVTIDDSLINETVDKTLLLKPHPVQLIAVFRLLGVDRVYSWWSPLSHLFSASDDSVPGHLIQVGTGEGKSVLLGGLAAVLSLLGYEVYCASYSHNLSERDYEAFEPLFDTLDVASRIHYSTLGGLAEELINLQGNIRSATENFLLSTESAVSNQGRVVKRILLLDEVDVFFSPEFFGKTYNPCTSYFYRETRIILEHIWDNRLSELDLAAIQALSDYQNLVNVFNPTALPLLEREISSMLRDVNNFSNPPYELVTQGDGSMKIGYKILDSVCFRTQYGYKKAFAYLHEWIRHPIDLSLDSTAFSLKIRCGTFSYAELPKWAFQGIIGVTGTLSSLSLAEQKIIADEYNLKTYTYTPSMYGESKLTFKKDSHVIMETDVNRYHQSILKDIVDQSQLGRPVIVYFESEEKLNEFRSSEYGQRLQDVNIVTEKTTNLPFYVTKATEAGKVTLFPRAFGRGLDFISRDTAVDAAGGVHVIQTFFSEFQSEEIQIRGRTARQSKRGTYKMILLSTDLERLGFTTKVLKRSYESESFYDELDAKRNEKVAESLGKLLEKECHVKKSHQRSLEFRDMILGCVPATPQEIVEKLMTL